MKAHNIAITSSVDNLAFSQQPLQESTYTLDNHLVVQGLKEELDNLRLEVWRLKKQCEACRKERENGNTD